MRLKNILLSASIALTTLSLQAQVAEVATEVAQEVAAEAEACDSASGIEACSDARAQAGSNEVQQGEPSDEKSEAARAESGLSEFCRVAPDWQQS